MAFTTDETAEKHSDTSPSIQDYTTLAGDYDRYRYVDAVDVEKEGRRRRVLTNLLPRHVPLAADIACGTGRGVGVLGAYAARVIGVDGTLAMLGVARGKLGTSASFAQANAGKLPFADATFDLVTSLNFVHLFGTVAEKAAFVTEMGRVVKPGGTLIVEFDNAMQGLVLGAVRKYFGKDIGYDWPWQIRACFRPDLFEITAFHGANLPFVWRWPALNQLDRFTDRFPMRLLASRVFVRARRR